MNQRRVISLMVWMVAAFLIVVGCSQGTPPNPSATSPESVEITVSAAASLQDAMKAIAPLYTQEQANVIITYNFGSSGSLQQQIEQGAPVDVFLSAAPKQMNALQEKDLLLTDTRKDLLKNSIVLVTPKDKTDISNFEGLTTDKVSKIAIGDPKSVPAGQYGKEVLTSLNLYKPIQSKLVFAKDVRQVLSYVETGNVQAGLVYATDANVSDNIKIVATAPETSHSPIIYPVAVLKESKHPDSAKKFVQFLSTETAKTVFDNYGFSVNGTL
ncbi:MAG: molybdate ABC transporter substrate-binding protein [Coleofasciculus chthonoplastes F3-SA18-01]|uniref:molybdate ABC transporter substrate-binding protein n=1 Tax=Coleofasciculus chthonoplastes TaxID=64178 RepID=UPI0033009445